MKIVVTILIVLILMGCQQAGSTRPTEHIAPDPRAAEINVRLGLNYMQRGDYGIALEKLEKALKQDPNSPTAHNTIALLHQYLGEDDKAEKHFKESVQRAPKYSEAHNNFGVFLCQQARYDEAEKHFIKAIHNPLYSSPAQALENAGLCVNRIPDPVRSEEYFRKALQINPNLNKSLLKMAEINYQRQDYLEARSYVERYKTVAPWSPQSLLIAIKTESKLNDQNAVSSYSVLLRGKFPDSEQAKQVKNGHY